MDTRNLNIPLEVKQEIEEFTAEVERLNRGEVGEEEFKRFRLQQGIYGQRQEDVHMVRTKLPMGRFTSDQMDCLADFAEKYSHGILHVTTRQDIQFHYVKLVDVPNALQTLADNGITTREACGNTVRNVTACHKAGTCKNELFDVNPYARAVSYFLIRHPLTQNLPRKFKISFGGCNGCGIAPIHDIGYNSVIREENGEQIKGFKVVIGGGLGSFPHAAQLLSDFVPTHDVLRMSEAIVRVFNEHGDKKNRNKARFKFVLDKYGLDKVKELIQENFDKLKNTVYPDIAIQDDSIPETPSVEADDSFESDPEFVNWKSRNTCEQKQEGYYNIHIKLLLGDFTIKEGRFMSSLARKYGAGQLVNTVNQNVMIPWVKPEAFGKLYGELKENGLHKAGTEELRDVTCCPGSETCNLGITASRGLADHLTSEFEKNYTDSKILDDISVKISGCPNSCGQHHIGSIGFHGGAKKINGILAPHYEMMLGGRVFEDQVVFGTSVIKIPAKNVPESVKRTTEAYKNEKLENETFPEFVDRKGKGYFLNMLSDLKELPDIEEAPESYIDYHSTEKFSLEDRGQGECAGAMTDMIQDHLSQAERTHFQAKLAIESNDYSSAVQHINRSVVASARGLLVTEGMDFSEDLETLQKFESLIVDAGIVSEEFTGIAQRFQEPTDSVDEAKAQSRFSESEELLKQSQNAYNKMQGDKSLRIRVGSEGNVSAKSGNGSSGGNGASIQSIDLLGVKCPFNYVKTKLKLETMESGQRLEVLLDDGDPVNNVPKSVQNDGHTLISLDKVDDHFKMVIEKNN